MSKAPSWDEHLREELKEVSQEFMAAAHVDDVFWQVQAIIASNPELSKGDVFQQWIAWTYTDSIAIRLRRIGDRRRDTVSLWRFLEALKLEEGRLTRTWYRTMWPTDLAHLANSRFDHLANPGARLVTAELITKKQQELHHALRAAEVLANDQVAHRRKSKVRAPMKFRDIRQCLVASFGVFEWCALLVDAASWETPVPTLHSDWLAVFRKPWLQNGEEVPEYRHLKTYREDNVH